MCPLVKLTSGNSIKLHAFDENTIDFYYFITIFHATVKKRINNPRERLTRLLEQKSRDAKEMIKHCLQKPLAQGCQHAKKTLTETYEISYHVMVEYRNEIQA